MRASTTSDLEEDMATLKCPHCDAEIDAERTWAQAALSTLMAAPAVPDMATQVRCTNCGRVSTASEMRRDTADTHTKTSLVVWLACVAVFIWAVAQLIQR
jgi:endogenous inhibitor of DNA gyrase (YacG/DUF329 family)